ncbi:uncharacterized protein F5891DRAFT_974120 [Suillus fuscotomentosus]|uniref:DUF6532 domain-containing protein n=1 Tax=Suillus fuscotomentosus TaxID=1912939 RepID=A0AAD4EMB1_9AGAM|nr:uncharacterized protein F5891DRAFT_974120 [Suillus fuscotomentosus]KAG1908812.1 hypothetical protein F5891DRAFT_974120 [Suillus fuscotomentosus]
MIFRFVQLVQFVLDVVPIPSAKARLPSQNHLGDQGLIRRDSQPTISSTFPQNDYECPTICSIRMIEVEVGKGDICMACKDRTTCDPAGVNALNTICGSTNSVCAGPSVMEPSSSSQPQDITPTKEVHQQIICKAKHGVVGWLFTKYAMSQTAADRKHLIKKAILDAVPRIFSLTVSFNSLVTKEQYRPVSQALTNARGKIIDIARSGVPHAYELYCPSGYMERTPTQYRVHIAMTLTRTGSLTVMHSHHFDPDGNIHVHSHFDHSFIKHIMIRFIWYLRHETFLGESPLTKINYIIAIAVAAVYCVLQEQRMPMPSIDPFTGLVHYNKFVEVIAVLDGLDGEDKKALESFKLDMLEVGPSQMHTNIEADDDDDDLLYE